VPPNRSRFAPRHALLAAIVAVIGSLLLAGSGSADPIDGGSGQTNAVQRIATATTQHPVGVTHFMFSRGKDRPLPITVWYPAVGTPHPHATPRVITDARPAAGRYPLIVWSHGFFSYPEQQQTITELFAANGFVIVAPLYPYTRKGTNHFNRNDVPNQSLDASFAITQLLRAGNPLAAHIDPARLAAAGHSGGGTTTNGLFTTHRDPRLKAAIVVSGRPLGAYTGTPVPMLFIHGDKDPVVAYSQGRQAYGAVPWPKAFLTMRNTEHGAALGEPDRGHTQVVLTMLDFLRWALDHDTAARDRLPEDATLAGVSTFESVGIFPANSASPAPARAAAQGR
jgi:dienelactone hydrolase